ncbi:MAG: hypothetical protein AAFN70_05965, partial [Planctomycetota bacterium]
MKIANSNATVRQLRRGLCKTLWAAACCAALGVSGTAMAQNDNGRSSNTGSITPEMLVGDMLVAEPLTQPPSKHAPETIAPKQARPAKQPQPDAAGKAMDITFPSSAASSPVKVARVAGTMPPANVLPEGAI